MSNIRTVRSVEEMIRFLIAKGGNHLNYYHYTTWDSVEKIVNNDTFLLTRGNATSINDQHEAIMKGSWQEWNKTYIGSFSYGESEIMAMWGLYGIPWEDAIRICIPRKQMIWWLSSINSVGIWQGNKVIAHTELFEKALTDVVYVSGQSENKNMRLTRAGESISTASIPGLHGIDQDPRMTGFIKNYSWQYENEVRLRIHLHQSDGSEKICIKIPDEVVRSMSFTTGPSFIRKDSTLYNELSQSGRLIESGFRNMVKYRSICSLCEHDSFVKKS